MRGIEYIEVRGEDLNVIGIIDTATSIIWHSVYFGVGDFEIYTSATPRTIELLIEGNYVTRTNNDEIGIIEHIHIANEAESGTMIIASGRFAKSILDRRLIYKLSGNTNTPTILRDNVEVAVREVIKDNAIACEFDSKRDMPILELGQLTNIPLIIVDENGKAAEKQVSYQNLLEYTEGVLEEYGMSSKCVLTNEKLQYFIFIGADRSVDNTEGNMPIIFSKENDNLLSSEYTNDTSTEKNVALIGGAGEGVDRFYSLIEKQKTGLQRREVWIDASSISKTYKDENNVEQTYTDEQYKAMLDTKGRQDIAQFVPLVEFDGVVDITNGNYFFGRDYSLGDIVTVQDNEIGKYTNVRIVGVTEVQDENGYTIDIEFQ